MQQDKKESRYRFNSENKTSILIVSYIKFLRYKQLKNKVSTNRDSFIKAQ